MKKQNKIQVKDLKARKDVKGGIHLDTSSRSTNSSSNKQNTILNKN
jgi:hypothetical protein